MTQVGDSVYSSGLTGKVTRVVGTPPHEQLYVDWAHPAGRPFEVNPEALPPEASR